MSQYLTEKSAGAVVFHENDEKREYLLLHYSSGHWDFPKGNIEKGEREEETVLREVREETGLEEVELVPGWRKVIRYFYRRQGRVVSKSVVFYLAKSLGVSVRISYEHQGFLWLPYEDAFRKLSYRNSREVLSEAEAFVAGGHKSGYQ